MTLQDQVRTAFSNVGRRKLRSALASLGVVVGTLTIVVMVSLAAGVREQINRQFESIGLDRLTVSSYGGHRGGFGAGGFNPFLALLPKRPLTSEVISNWQALRGVTKVLPEVDLPGAVDLNLEWNGTHQSVRMGGGDVRPGMMFQEAPEPLAGSLELPTTGGIILSEGIVEAAGISSNHFSAVIGQPVDTVLRTSRGETQRFHFQILGVSLERSRSIQVAVADRIAMKNWWFNSTNTLETEGYDYATIRAVDVTSAQAVAKQLKKDGYQVQSLELVVEVANRIVTAITVMFTLIGSIALLVATIGIANTMVMAIYERTREIGILKATGASRREIRQMFMLEAGFIGMIGGVIGLLLGWLLGLALNQAIQMYMQYKEMPVHGHFFVVSLTLTIGVILFATFIGLLAGLLPAQRAAKLDPLEALRHE